MKQVPSSPADLGLDGRKFPEWRDHQRELLEEVINTDKEFILVGAPTGFGKSLFAAALAKLTSGVTHYLVTTKTLQDQIRRDFPGAFNMWGRNMHYCSLPEHETETVDKALCTLGFTCPIKADCTYYAARASAPKVPLLVTNYYWYWNNNERGEPLPPADMLIMDEADAVEQAVMNFASIEVTRAEAYELGLEMPTPEGFRAWVESAEQIAGSRAEYLVERHKRFFGTELKPENPDSVELMRDIEKYRGLLERLARMQNGWKNFAHLYVTDLKPECAAIRPIVATLDAQRLIHGRNPATHKAKKVFMSGTILSKEGFCRELAIDPAQALYVDVPSTFPAERRPFVLHDVTSLNAKTLAASLDLVTEWVDGMIDAYEGKKGIVHTANYQIARHILRGSHNRDILIGHSSDNRDVAIKHFKHRRQAVIVSPSLVRGEDFPGFHCEWQAIVKAPFPNITDPQVAARMKLDETWLGRMTLRNVIQAYGRGMRSADDYCETHAFDSNIGRLLRQNKAMVPGYIRAAIITKERTE